MKALSSYGRKHWNRKDFQASLPDPNFMRFFQALAVIGLSVAALPLNAQDPSPTADVDALQSLWKNLEAQQAQVTKLRKQLAGNQATVDRMMTDLRSVSIGLESTESTLAVRGQISQVVQQQLSKKIEAWKPGSVSSPPLKKRIAAYQQHLDQADKTYDRSSEVKTLVANQTKLLQTRKSIQQAIRQPLEAFRQTRAELDEANRQLAQLRREFAILKLQTVEQAAQSAPAYLEKVEILASRNRGVYEATWTPVGILRQPQVERLNALIDAQFELLNARALQLARWSEIVQMRNAECLQIIAESEDAVWRQYWQIPVAEMSVSARASTLPEANRRAVFSTLHESGDRLLLLATGKAAWNYEHTGSLGSYGLFPIPTMEQLAAMDWSETQQMIRAAAKEESTRQIYGDSGLQGLARVWTTAAQIPSVIATRSLVEETIDLDVNETWLSMVTSVDRDLIETAPKRLPDFELPDETRQAWKEFAKLDARRMVAVAHFKSTAALHWIDRHVLNLLLDELDRVTDGTPAKSFDRILVRTKDEELQRKRDYFVKLRFSRPGVVISKVTLGGMEVAVDESELTDSRSPNWNGKIRFDNIPSNGQLVVEVEGLDDPVTAITLDPMGENWLGYEPGNDLNHRLRTERRPERSFVLVLNPGSDLDKTKATVAAIFNEEDFGAGDELALYLATDSGIVRASSFTQNHAQVWSSIESATAQENSLPPWAVVTAGRYLYNQGRGAEKRLILIEDQPAEKLNEALLAVREMRTLATIKP